MNRPVTEKHLKLSRRDFIIGSAAIAGGGLALGMNVPFAYAEGTPAGATQVNLWVAIKPDDTCVIRVARSEMGQGTLTGLAQLVAEELECDWAKVTTQGVTPGENLASKRAWGEMGTGGSRGIRTSQDYVRKGGAAARMMLVQAAATQLNVPVGELTVSKGVIAHGASQRSLRYGEVAAAAGKLTPPDTKDIKLKDPKTWTIAGRALKRLDTADKLDGSKIFAIDLKLPGMLCAAIKDCPVFGGKLKSYDESKVLGMPGVKKVVKVKDTGVAVVADTWWRAKKALDALPIVWDEGENATKSSATIAEMMKEGLTATATNGERQNGDALKAIAEAPKKLEATYSTPFLAHAPLEMMNCTVKLSADRADAWVPTQNLEASLAALSESSGVPLANCEIHRHDLGGGFGRRGGTQDYVHQAAEIAKSFPDTPIKMIWTREEDQAHDFYRPISQCKLSAGLDNDGKLVGLHVRVSGQSINAIANPNAIVNGKDMRQLQGYYDTPGDAQLGYDVPNLLIEYAMRNSHVPVGPWRGVNTNQNAVYMECFMEELARAAGKDSLEFRRALMKEHPKHLAVLEAVAEKAGWGTPLPAGVHRGLAQFMGYGSYSAAVAEVSVSPQGKLKVHRMVLGVNSGHAVNPGQIEAQVQGSVAFGLTATLYGEMPVEKGRMTSLNFDSYEIMRLAEMPKVETVIVPTYDFWGGIGEPTICVVAPSVMNAIYAATGKPVRSLPLKNVKLV
ncbi:xanthine dehydrogenase family protein molybdopterin-binding subunit [Bradyrhizobium erythrophlei]|uniref:Isoquinoline 1-oxidoreductase, beta subunit n=1 Tax=Bradyrhizobium erythrophlei TaxID=1437360 RepID=A0A1M7UF40_9BRAD|nr:molybdopterin cofactor-binding domain-containing protein [Bradyrhizobium erythrophlei]SHN81578.1 isoquinoline 1-oxidoreductase, beta subunit [Bradyrhizobium erythrophlei]